ncbi:AAA family ATPase [Clostridium sp.]|uniref:AAA family ATPase n=1 Tax=Clostridium sp. TaxID=1506 RepID=UPI00321660DD
MGKYGKKNEIKIDPLKYNICMLGEPKIGKTTIIKEMLEKLAGEDGYMFLEMAGEAGADAIQGIIYEDCDEWSDVEDIVDDIIDNKTTDYPDLRAIVADTYDGWIKLAQEEAVRLWNVDHPDKRADTIDASWNGFQKGQAKAFELMFEIITKLRRVGVATIIIGHVKNRELTDIATGTSYQTLTSDVEKIYFNLLKKKMHFLGLGFYDRTIITEKTGKKNIVTKKEETINKITGESRKIKFRDDNMALDSGSRFANIVDEVDFNVDELIKAIEDAIRAEASKGNKSVDQLEAEQKEAEKERMKQIAEEEKKNKVNKELKEVVNSINAFIKENKKDMNVIKPILAKCKEFGATKPSELADIKSAKEVAKLIG